MASLTTRKAARPLAREPAGISIRSLDKCFLIARYVLGLQHDATWTLAVVNDAYAQS